jgi:hypothetical protein
MFECSGCLTTDFVGMERYTIVTTTLGYEWTNGSMWHPMGWSLLLCTIFHHLPVGSTLQDLFLEHLYVNLFWIAESQS